MIVTHQLTLGQITFILRVSIQILSYGGLFLIGLIVLGTIPRVASAETHGVINRIVGKSSATKASILWAFRYFRRRSGDPITSVRFLLAVLLLVFYSLFVVVSDVGFIGFYACSTAYPPTVDYPASLSTDTLARSAIAANLINGTDPATVNLYRCDAVSVHRFSENITERVCTAWHNSTYADPNVFRGINSTDSDVLMLRRLKRRNHSRSAFVDLNSFYISPGSQRVVNPFLANGLAIVPHETGVRAVLGVPQLAPQQSVTLDKTMALEADMGCMPLGIYSQHNLDASFSRGIDIYATNSSFKKYTGPELFRDVLSTYVDQIRQEFLPFFNTSSLDEGGFMVGINSSRATFVKNAAIKTFFLPSLNSSGSDVTLTGYILGNCTEALRQHLNITAVSEDETVPNSCSLLAIAGSSSMDGDDTVAFSRMLCASATQVNMVSATVEMSAEGSLSVDLTRLPSDLNYLSASYWDESVRGNDTIFAEFTPLERLTLADNPSGQTSHYIPSTPPYINVRGTGPGSGGNAIARLAPVIINANGVMDISSDFAAILTLDDGNKDLNFSSAAVTRWGGQVGASFLLNSLAYNGWAARSSAPVTVYSTGGRVATCYRPLYALAFLPLVFTAGFVMAWALLMVIESSFAGHKRLEESYGGLSPYVDAVCPTDEHTETLLAWQNDAKPRLEILTKERGMHWDNGSTTALGHLNSPRSPP